MTPKKLQIICNKKQYTIYFYCQINGYNWMASCEEVIGAFGLGKTWDEAANDCEAALKNILLGKMPASLEQEIQKYTTKEECITKEIK